MESASLVEVLRTRLRTSRDLAPALPPDRELILPSADDPESEDIQPDPAAYETLSTSLFIEYVDALGCESRRRITLMAVVTQPNDLLLHCYCHERAAPRCFRASRIRETIDLATGELVQDTAELIRRLACILNYPAESSLAATQDALRRCRHGLVVLTFLARCDGYLHPSEMQVLLNYLDHNAQFPGIDPELADWALRRLDVNRHAYDRAVNALSQRQDDLWQVARFARRLIDADGTLSPEESEFAIVLQRAMKPS